MNEIDLVRGFRAEASTRDDGETQRARCILLEAIAQDRKPAISVRERLRRTPRRTFVVALALVVLPASYAIADGAGLFGKETVTRLTPATAIPAPAPGDESAPPADTPQGTGDLAPDPAIGAPGSASERSGTRGNRHSHAEANPPTGRDGSKGDSE